MSYILEALKKLEQKQRAQRSAIPDLLDSFDTVPVTRRRPLWPYLVFAAFMLNAGVLIWWMHPWSSGTQKTGTPRIAEQGLHHERTATPRAGSPIETKTNGHEKGQVRQAPAKEGNIPAMVSPSLQKKRPTTHLQSEPSPLPAAVADSSAHKVLSLAELPSSVQQGLPEIKISLHYYAAEPSSRMARINDKTLREGEDLTAGLKLEEITPAGIVFSYQTYRFLIKAF